MSKRHVAHSINAARLRRELAFHGQDGSGCDGAEARLKILLFGRLGEEIGRDIVADVPAEGCTVAALRKRLVAGDPACAPLARPSVRACVDQVIVAEDFVVRPGQEVAFVPPLSGG